MSTLITEKLDIITIGIGASAGCDGQVLVYQDMLGMCSDRSPSFVKRFANIGEEMKQAFQQYDTQVKSGAFPTEEQTYRKSDCSDEFLQSLAREY